MRVLVTGATGFVGANLVLRLLQEGHQVHVLAREEAKFWRLQTVMADIHLHSVNLQDAQAVKTAVARIRPEWVMHLAAYGAYSYQTDLKQMIETNLTGTANLLQACEVTGFSAFINTGSSSEYGFKAYPPLETEWLEPNSHYAITKAAATHLCSYTSRRLSMPITTLRLYSVYGPYEEPTRLIPKLIRNGLAGKYPPLVSPDTARDFVYSDDVIDAYLLAATTPNLPLGAVYNIGSGRQTLLGEVVETVRQLFKIAKAPDWGAMEQRIWDTTIWVADITRAKAQLGWEPHHTTREGLEQAARWLSDHLEFYPLES